MGSIYLSFKTCYEIDRLLSNCFLLSPINTKNKNCHARGIFVHQSSECSVFFPKCKRNYVFPIKHFLVNAVLSYLSSYCLFKTATVFDLTINSGNAQIMLSYLISSTLTEELVLQPNYFLGHCIGIEYLATGDDKHVFSHIGI